MRIAYIFTTFPKLSERFFLREVLELQSQGMDLSIYSMIGGENESEAGPVRRMKAFDWFVLWYELLIWCFLKPRIVGRLLVHLNPFRYRSVVNYGENALGIAFAIRFARIFQSCQYDRTHATWATGPGMVVWALGELIDQPYTLEGHAYDVFRDGGDAFLDQKLSRATALRSSTEATTTELRQRISAQGLINPVTCVRRGLEKVPPLCDWQYPAGGTLRVLSVGRLIEKKGYLDQLKIFAYWMQQGIAFDANIVGEGPERAGLEQAITELGLGEQVHLLGKLDYAAVERTYQSADLFIFAGKVSESGDRDGFPNVIGEAMSYGLPVFSSDVSGTTEGVKDTLTGYIIDPVDFENAAMCIYLRMQAGAAVRQVRVAAHSWVCREFSVQRNAVKLKKALWGTD